MKRIYSIDFIRGLVMIIMALDHSRDLLHVHSIDQNPTDLSTTTPILFFTRWITHLCAPIFVFLSGTSAFLSIKNQPDQDTRTSRRFLLTRGLWLILLEFTIVNFAIWYDIHFQLEFLQVIFTIGFGFILLSTMIKVPPKILAMIGLILIFGHDLITTLPPPANPVARFITSFLFAPGLFPITSHLTIFVGYPALPWFGIMLTGFACGQLFWLPAPQRKKIFWQTGMAVLILFVILRYINIYGDPSKWSHQKDALFTFLSFMNVSKYPPSLLYTLVTLGIMFLLLAVMENVTNPFTRVISTYGKVPLFYYLIHWYVLHTIMLIVVFAQGFHAADLQFGAFLFGRPKSPSGLPLAGVYGIWFGVVCLMYPLCRWYSAYKSAHRDNKWLRYL
jgi:uncharacterized membrane protein